jgi:vancomycin permeability regulator SanA
VAVVYLAATLVQVRLTADSDDSSKTADAAIVLGAAQYDGTPSPVLATRLDEAYDLYMTGLVSSIVLTGANAEGDRFTEAYSGFTYLRQKGVAEDDLIIVDDGTSTWESLAASGRVLEASDVDTVLLVSDPYHSHRLLGIADELGLEAGVSPTDASAGLDNYVREALIVGLGRLIGYRRIVRLTG